MPLSPSPYASLIELYVNLIRRESAAAADEIEAICAQWGMRMAYQAAFTLTHFKAEIEQSGGLPDQALYACYIGAGAEFVPVIRQLIKIYVSNRS